MNFMTDEVYFNKNKNKWLMYILQVVKYEKQKYKKLVGHIHLGYF
jgi:hypothetical protein